MNFGIDHYDLWYRQPIVMLDVETTGLSHDLDRVIQLGLARFEHGKVVDSWSTLLWSGVEVPEEAARVHGITTDKLADAPTLIHTIPTIVKMSRGAQPAAYNQNFDKKFFFAEIGRLALQVYRLPLPLFDIEVPWVDPLVWVRHVDRFEKGGNKLDVACYRRGIQLSSAHDAKADAVAAGQVLYSMLDDIGDMTMSELLRQQQVLGEAQERRLAAWRSRQGR